MRDRLYINMVIITRNVNIKTKTSIPAITVINVVRCYQLCHFMFNLRRLLLNRSMFTNSKSAQWHGSISHYTRCILLVLVSSKLRFVLTRFFMALYDYDYVIIDNIFRQDIQVYFPEDILCCRLCVWRTGEITTLANESTLWLDA